MAGPGGGSHGGGGGRGFGGGSFGGGGRGFGGGFHGGPRPPHHHHHHYGWGWGFHRPYRHYYYGGGGCLGGLFGLMLAPIIVIFMAAALLFFSISGMVSDVASGGSYQWDDDAIRQYARAEYDNIYGNNDAAYEDNIMILFLADEEEGYTYAYIAWVGDNIDTHVDEMFGNGYTRLGTAFDNSMPDNYKDSLGKNLSAVVERMEAAVGAPGAGKDHFKDAPLGTANSPVFKNGTLLPISSVTMDRALKSFYETTGISLSFVVADIDEVFEKGLESSTYIMLVIGIGLAVLAVFLIVRAVKEKKNGGNPPSGGDSQDGPNVNGENDPRYNPYSNMRF